MGAIVIKLGSSIVADDAGQPRVDVLAHVCEEAAALHRAGHDVAIVTSGAIARGMGVMRLSERPRAIDELQAASAVGQGKLYAVYDELLRGHGIASAQVLLTFHDISGERAHYLNARQTLRKLLEWRVVPVVNENDTTATDEITFGDNDFLAAQVAILIGAELLVLLTSTDGLYTADPRLDPDARAGPARGGLRARSRRSTSARRRRRSAPAACARRSSPPRWRPPPASPPSSRTGRAGRDRRAPSRASRSARASAAGGRATRASSCGSSTRSPRAGTIAVDAGAARALREGGTSLLPVGIVAVEGGFDAGDAVDVVHDGAAVGKGIASCSAADLRRVMGLKSEEARELLPHATEEAIHRDHFVLA